MKHKNENLVPIVVGLFGLICLAVVSGCGTLHTAYNEAGEPVSLSLKIASAAPSPEKAKTAGESVSDTVAQVDEAGAAILNSSLVQAGIGILTGGSLLGGVGAFAAHRGRKAEHDKQKAIRDEHNSTWEESQLDLLRKLQMQGTETPA